MSNPLTLDFRRTITKLYGVLGKSNTGFTLIEMLAAVIIIGIVAAIAAPNLLGLLNRNRVNQGLAEADLVPRSAKLTAFHNPCI